MADGLKPGEEIGRFRWRAHGVNEVALDQGLIFTRTRPEVSLDDMKASLASWRRNPDAPGQMPQRPALDYEPLKQTNLPNALARVALAADRESDINRERYQELRQRFLRAGEDPQVAQWLARREVGRLAELAAIREVKRFYRRYGELGFYEQPRDPEQRWPQEGEPLGWVIAEATTVRFALDVIDALKRDDLHDLKKALARRKYRGERSDNGRPSPDELPGRIVMYELCCSADFHGYSWNSEQEPWKDPDAGWYEHVSHRLHGENDEDLKDHAGRIVADLLRRHLPGQTYGFFWHDGHFLELPERGPLLRAIWLHIMDAAKGREIRHCRECGSPFLVTDQRQRFCPPDAPGGKSRCLARRQMREARIQAKSPTAEEEATE